MRNLKISCNLVFQLLIYLSIFCYNYSNAQSIEKTIDYINSKFNFNGYPKSKTCWAKVSLEDCNFKFLAHYTVDMTTWNFDYNDVWTIDLYFADSVYAEASSKVGFSKAEKYIISVLFSKEINSKIERDGHFLQDFNSMDDAKRVVNAIKHLIEIVKSNGNCHDKVQDKELFKP